ncbi:MAG TPA: 3-deoxy-D-manno-octulosonic acid transferase [Pyrinomonadaceae bacterium]|nr:3-deoxy-D-manno-octulosonic acid transferase [Pyrinomonadaceae bacterium]
MYLAYSLLLTLGLLVLIPHFLFQALAYGKYVAGLRQRFGGLNPINNGSRSVIWLHCVSVGETQAARPLAARLRTEFPDSFLVVSTITATGQSLARNVFQNHADAIIYFPFDWKWTVRRAIKAINPDLVLVMETELWPNFLRECNSRGIPVVLVNGRISAQSFRRYRLVRFFFRNVLAHLRMAVMQSDRDAERIASLGMRDERLFTTGNLKFDVDCTPPNATTTELLRERFALRPDVPLLLAASTHAPEEKIILKSFQRLRALQPLRLMIAPRRPERFQEVAKLIEETGLTWAQRTGSPTASDSGAEIILLDTIGELPTTYALASIVFVGGSIVDRGGHNVLEPAATGACVVTGHHTHNFQAIVQLLTDADAIVQIPLARSDEAELYLTQIIQDLLRDERRRVELGRQARKIVRQNQGATDRTISLIKPLFKNHGVQSSAHEKVLATNSSGS